MAAQVPVEDPTTQSNYLDIATENVALDWTIDFEKKCIHGSATHELVARVEVSEVMCVVASDYPPERDLTRRYVD
jgi:leukotriene-A4 hydrolase